MRPEGKDIDNRYDPLNPKESRVANEFEVFKPVETLLGTGFLSLAIGALGLYLSRVISTATGDDDELNQPIEYFEAKRKKNTMS